MFKAAVWLLLASCIQPGWARTARSLDQVPSLLETPESKGAFSGQMDGAPLPDRLGTRLPARLPAAQVAALLLPAAETAAPSVVGAKPLPGQAGLYAAIACTGGSAMGGNDDRRCARSQGDDAEPALRVYLGVIEARGGAAPRLLAKPVLVDGTVDWRDSGLPTAPDDPNGERARPDSFDSLELAPYRMTPGQWAFGLRSGWSDSYSGGLAYHGALYLFAVVDGTLRQVLSAPMSSYKDVAGDWHRNGTRDHEITEGAKVLVVSAQATAGHHDLLLKSRTSSWRRLFRWSAASATYRAVGRRPG